MSQETFEQRQARTAKGRATNMRRADEKRAAILRERGWTCIPPARTRQDQEKENAPAVAGA